MAAPINGNGKTQTHPHIILKATLQTVTMNPGPEIKTSNISPDDILQTIAAGFEQSAAAIFNNYIREIMFERTKALAHPMGITEPGARQIAQENVGYESARYSHVIAERAEILLGAYHPVFGKVEERKDNLDITALTAGYLLGRLVKAGYKLEETLLYYPNRKLQNLTLEVVLKNPEYDPILGPLSILTAQEQQELDDKSDAFFKNLGVW